MSIKQLIAIVAIFLFACAGWIVLGAATKIRSTDFGSRLGRQVSNLYGSTLIQRAPTFSVNVPGAKEKRWLMPESNTLKTGIEADYRKKGMLWFSSYRCSFDGSYVINNTEDAAQKIRFHFDFPDRKGSYDNFNISIDGAPISAPIDTRQGVDEIVELASGASITFRIQYDTRGLNEWRYQLDPNSGRVRDFDLEVKTNFENFDYPEGCWSATATAPNNDGTTLTWKTTDLITTQNIGVTIPEKINPGPLTTRITFFAPVCLLFFFVLVMTLAILYKIPIHPMHYLFVAAGFFAFHLLLSYLAGIVNIHAAFAISTVTSVTMVTTYLSGALRGKFPWKVAIAGQLFFLVLFSYSFFLKGITGLTVAIGSVVTLAILMRVTANVNWNEVFERNKRTRGNPPPIKKREAE